MKIKMNLNTLLDIKVMMVLYHYIKLPQVNAFDKHFDSNNKYLNLFVLDEELLKKIYSRMG